MLKKFKKISYHLSHFTFPFSLAIIFTLFLLFTACSDTTSTQKGNLTGNINLAGLEDHSGIIVAIYDLAYLDTTIVRINNQYPHIGVKISQHTEFDHRFQSPIAQSTTDSEGNFEIDKIPTGTYNFVAIKDSFGFKYLYEINVNKGDNELGEDIALYEAEYLSDTIQDDWIFQTDHHYIIEDDTDFVPGTYLEIQPGAVVRINPGQDLIIHGNLSAQGEQDHMFWVTSNHGFTDDLRVKSEKGKVKSGMNSNETHEGKSFSPLTSHLSQSETKSSSNLSPSLTREIPKDDLTGFTFHTKRDSLALYNSMQLSTTASLTNDLIEWGKWDWGNTCLLNKVDNLTLQNGIFRNGSCGLLFSSFETLHINNILSSNNYSENLGSIAVENVTDGIIEHNIICNNSTGIYSHWQFQGTISNNYITKNYFGILVFWFRGNLLNNEFIDNTNHIVFTGNDGTSNGECYISYNNIINGGKALYHFGVYNMNYAYFPEEIQINYNNFINNILFFDFSSQTINDQVYAINNYWNGITNTNEIKQLFNDRYNPSNVNIIDIEPILMNKIFNAGIQ